LNQVQGSDLRFATRSSLWARIDLSALPHSRRPAARASWRPCARFARPRPKSPWQVLPPPTSF